MSPVNDFLIACDLILKTDAACRVCDRLGWLGQTYLLTSHHLVATLAIHVNAFRPVHGTPDDIALWMGNCVSIAGLKHSFDLEINKHTGNYLPDAGECGALPLKRALDLFEAAKRLMPQLEIMFQLDALQANEAGFDLVKRIQMFIRQSALTAALCYGCWAMKKQNEQALAAGGPLRHFVDLQYHPYYLDLRLNVYTATRNALIADIATTLDRA